MDTIILNLAHRDILNKKTILSTYQEFKNGNTVLLKNIWQFIALEIWLEIFIDKKWSNY